MEKWGLVKHEVTPLELHLKFNYFVKSTVILFKINGKSIQMDGEFKIT